MKFAFSTLSCPNWDFDTLAQRAREWGYEGMEIFASPRSGTLLTSNLLLNDARTVRRCFESTSVEVACVATMIGLTGQSDEDVRLAAEVRVCIDAAQRLGCRRVKVCDTRVRPGQDRMAVIVALGDWLARLGDYAAPRGVTVVVENALSFRSAQEMWTVLDRIAHPAIASCWDLLVATRIGESPNVSVPFLNSRIQYAYVTDARLAQNDMSYCALGTGDVPVEKFITRLRGIGFSEYVTYEWDKVWHPELAEPQVVLPAAIAKLKAWRGDGTPKSTVAGKPAAAKHAKVATPAAAGS